MDPLKILHIASFSGNIGDNANHIGFRPWLERVAERPVEWTNLEIREFYWRERQWDGDFVDMANSYDALIIGGGNYFELWVETSPTGTSIAITPELFARIRVPIFFNALGVDPGQGVPENSRTRFTTFLDTLLGSNRYLVSVRNDGAMLNLRKHIGVSYADAVNSSPDHGFFSGFEPLRNNRLVPPDPYRRRIAINVASDMAEVRFSGFADQGGQSAFVRELAHAVSAIASECPETDFLLMPHIFRDLEIQSELISHLPDRLRRTRLIVGPYGTGNGAARDVFGLYALADVTLGMRFHANVCPLGMQRQTLGLVCYPQISALYQELDQIDRVIDVSAPGFTKTMKTKVGDALYAPAEFTKSPKDAIERVSSQRRAFEPAVSRWLSRI
jgi:hypothetical protein